MQCGGMSSATNIDVEALKRAVIEFTSGSGAVSRRKLSLDATSGKNPDLVRDLISRGQDRMPSFQSVAGLASAMGRNVDDFTINAAGSREDKPIRIPVVGTVEAGVWREVAQDQGNELEEVVVYPSRISAPGRFALRVNGYSMDRLFPPGTILDCLSVPFAGENGPQPRLGDIVIAERSRGGLIETTCKRLDATEDGSFVLRAESSRPEFQTPVQIGRPDNNFDGDDTVRIIAVVNSAIMHLLER